MTEHVLNEFERRGGAGKLETLDAAIEADAEARRLAEGAASARRAA